MRQTVHVAERDLKRLGEAVEAARERLDMTQEEFAQACDLGLTTIQRVEAGKVKPRTKTYKRLDQGAGWTPGSARRVVEHAEPPTLRTDYPDELKDDVERKLWRIEELTEDQRWRQIYSYRVEREVLQQRTESTHTEQSR